MADDHALWGHSAGRRLRELRHAGPSRSVRAVHHRERNQRPHDRPGGRVRGEPRRPGGEGLHRHGGRRDQPRAALRPAPRQPHHAARREPAAARLSRPGPAHPLLRRTATTSPSCPRSSATDCSTCTPTWSRICRSRTGSQGRQVPGRGLPGQSMTISSTACTNTMSLAARWLWRTWVRAPFLHLIGRHARDHQIRIGRPLLDFLLESGLGLDGKRLDVLSPDRKPALGRRERTAGRPRARPRPCRCTRRRGSLRFAIRGGPR